MTNKNIIIALLASFFVLNGVQAQSNTATNSTKTTAQLVSSCQMTAQNVSFGGLVLPLTTQTATSNLNVLCNKSASYTIEMAYGGVYGKNYPGSTYYATAGVACNASTPTYNTYDVLTGTKTGTSCGIPSGAVYGSDGRYYTGTPVTAANYGKMIGSAKGDNVAYSLEVPGKSGTVWNATNKYTATGTGSLVSIPVKATLVPEQSGNSYPIPDLYTDTVTAKISF